MLKRMIQVSLVILLIGVMMSLVYGLYLSNQPEYDACLNVAFVGTAGEADCIVLWQRDFAMMIDTGEERDEKAIISFLSEQNITKLNYLILTHPDKDHIGSAAALVRTMKVDRVIEPFYQKENDRNRDLQVRLAQKQVKVIVPTRILHYTVNDMRISVFPPLERTYPDDNHYSLAVLVQHRDVAMLFPGDATGVRLMELMKQKWDSINLYKLPYHGRYDDYSNLFYSELRPPLTVVTADQASQRMTGTGNKWGTEWFYTVGHTVIFQSDGDKVQVLSPSEEPAKEDAASF